MNPIRFVSLLAVAVALLSTANPADAQVDPDSVHRRNECRLAVQIITTGQPAARTEWAWYRIGRCDQALQLSAYQSAIEQARFSTDVAFVERAMMQAVFFRDGRTFALLLEVAEDRSATTEARVMAFVALTLIRSPRVSPDYHGFRAGLDEHGNPRGVCSMRTFHPVPYRHGPNPLPLDHIAQIAQVRTRVYHDPTEPVEIRSAAACG